MNYIDANFTATPDKIAGWEKFPKVLIRAMMGNTYFYTRMIEMS